MIESMREVGGDVDKDNSNRSPTSADDDEEVAVPNGELETESVNQDGTRGKLNKATADIRKVPARGKVLESMESTQRDSLDSELDLDGDDDDDGSDLDSEDELELVNLTKGKGSGTKKPEGKGEAGLLSDDDF